MQLLRVEMQLLVRRPVLGPAEVRPWVAHRWVRALLLEGLALSAGRRLRVEAGLWAGHLRQRLVLRATRSLAQHWVVVGLWAAGQRLAWGSLPIRVGLA